MIACSINSFMEKCGPLRRNLYFLASVMFLYMVDKMDHLYAVLDDLDDDLQAMQEDLEAVLLLLKDGEIKKAQTILEEMNSFLIDFLEPEEGCECDDDECECYVTEEGNEDEEEVEEKPAAKPQAEKPAPKKKK